MVAPDSSGVCFETEILFKISQEKQMKNQPDTLVLEPKTHNSLGSIHCGVSSKGRVVVGGKLINLENNDEYIFENFHIKAERHGSEYIFTKLH